LGGRSHLADRNQRQFHSRFSESYAITGVDTDALFDALAVHERAKGAVIQQDEFIAVVHECAVAAGNSGETVRERYAAGRI
jgi:hypothetical protein